MNVNSVTLIGNVTNDPETKEFGEGGRLTKFGLATSSRSKDKEKRTAEFHNVVTFGPLAKICSDYVSKGRLIYIRGKLKTRKWEDDNQTTRYKTEVIADDAGEVVGFDLTPEMVNSALRRCQENGQTNVHFAVGHAEKLPFHDASFSTILTPQILFPLFGKPIHNEFTSYGLGWWLTPKDGNMIIEHSGGIDGMGANLMMEKNNRIGIIVLSNQSYSAIPFVITFDVMGNLLNDKDYSSVSKFFIN